MDIGKAIMALSQSEKIKAGLIWMSQALEVYQGLGPGEKKGAEKMSHALLNMIGYEINLAKAVVGHGEWDEIQSHIDKAIVMVNSGVGQEATIHLSKALSRVTTIGHQAMSYLKEKNLL